MTTTRTAQPTRPEAGMQSLRDEVARRGMTAVRRDCRTALRTAWPHRQSRRAKIVMRANIDTLRDLRLI